MKTRPANFVTLWLRKGDEEDVIKRYGRLMVEVMNTHCGSTVGEPRIAKSGRRITVSTLCKTQRCSKPKDTMRKITEEITRRTNRTAKGIALCGES